MRKRSIDGGASGVGSDDDLTLLNLRLTDVNRYIPNVATKIL